MHFRVKIAANRAISYVKISAIRLRGADTPRERPHHLRLNDGITLLANFKVARRILNIV